jgi:hypothetical protein
MAACTCTVSFWQQCSPIAAYLPAYISTAAELRTVDRVTVAAPRWHARPRAAAAPQAFSAAQGDAFSAQWLLEYCRMLLRKAAQAAKPSQPVIAGAMAGLASALSVCPVRACAPAAAPGSRPDKPRPRSLSRAPACGAPWRSGRQAALAPASRCGRRARADTRAGAGRRRARGATRRTTHGGTSWTSCAARSARGTRAWWASCA